MIFSLVLIPFGRHSKKGNDRNCTLKRQTGPEKQISDTVYMNALSDNRGVFDLTRIMGKKCSLHIPKTFLVLGKLIFLTTTTLTTCVNG